MRNKYWYSLLSQKHSETSFLQTALLFYIYWTKLEPTGRLDIWASFSPGDSLFFCFFGMAAMRHINHGPPCNRMIFCFVLNTKTMWQWCFHVPHRRGIKTRRRGPPVGQPQHVTSTRTFNFCLQLHTLIFPFPPLKLKPDVYREDISTSYTKSSPTNLRKASRQPFTSSVTSLCARINSLSHFLLTSPSNLSLSGGLQRQMACAGAARRTSPPSLLSPWPPAKLSGCSTEPVADSCVPETCL